jgi:tartrate dehydrogenase/decarboxylase/D-malate dehydrogenase
MSREVKVAAIAGDGIGKEVLPPSLALVDAAAKVSDLSITWDLIDWSSDTFLKTGKYIPEGGMERLMACEAIYFGAVGDPRVADHESLWGLLLSMRQNFQQNVNVRPIKRLPVPSPLASPLDFDILLVRENVEGEYTPIGGQMRLTGGNQVAMQVSVFSKFATEAVAHYAFQQARLRKSSVCAATKSNALAHSMTFWEDVIREVATQYPDVSLRFSHIDALAAEFILRPWNLDVVVGSNLFADVLADIGAAIMGSIGVAASGNINPERTMPSLFEPVHGSAPDIVNRGIANPTGQLLTAAMMLDHLGAPEGAELLRSSVVQTLANPKFHTGDVGGTATTSEVFAEVARRMAPLTVSSV